MIKILSLAAGLTGAAIFSQFPAFSQQYVQRLAGQVDALTEVVLDFDTSALAAGFGREEALRQMTGTDFLTARQSDMRETFARHARLSGDLAAVRAATPMQRLMMPQRFTDVELAKAAYADFSPAVPLNSAGAVAAGAGAIAGWTLASLFLSLFTLPFRAFKGKLNRLRHPDAMQRREPVLRKAARPTPLLRGDAKWQERSSPGVVGTGTNPTKLPGFLMKS